MSKFFKYVFYGIVVLGIMIVWDFVYVLFNISPVILPSFHGMLNSFMVNFQEIAYNTFITFFETVIGLVITLIFSFGMVILINENLKIKPYFLKFIYIFQMIPLIAIAPLIIIWFGIGIGPKIILIMLYSSFAIIVTTLDAFENISQAHKLYMLSLTKNKIKLYRYLYFPLSYSQIFSGIKIAVTYSVVCAITGEYIGSKHGLGILLNRAYSSYQTDLVFVIIILIVMMTLLILGITNQIEKKLRR